MDVRKMIVVLFATFFTACRTTPTHPVTVHVAAAVSLRVPLEQLASLYQQSHKDTRVQFSFGASGDLATHIVRGAPVALFASASHEPIQRLGHTVRTTVLCSLAGNELVLIRRPEAALATLRWENLATHPAVERIALGISPTVPAGVYAEQALRALALYDTLQPKLVRGGTVRQVLDLVARGEADVGMVYATDVRGRTDVVNLGPPPPHARPTVRYPLAFIATAEHASEAHTLGVWLCSAEGQRVFVSNGFTIP
jgi:molybdate transport system substrate-binding protein